MSAEQRMLEDILHRLDEQARNLKKMSSKLDKVVSAIQDLSVTIENSVGNR